MLSQVSNLIEQRIVEFIYVRLFLDFGMSYDKSWGRGSQHKKCTPVGVAQGALCIHLPLVSGLVRFYLLHDIQFEYARTPTNPITLQITIALRVKSHSDYLKLNSLYEHFTGMQLYKQPPACWRYYFEKYILSTINKQNCHFWRFITSFQKYPIFYFHVHFLNQTEKWSKLGNSLLLSIFANV